jgi:putative transcriptional regulator
MTNIQNTLGEMAKDLYSVGAIDKMTLRQFDSHSLPPVPNYTAITKLPILGINSV